jgi:hypothetical protein
MAKKVQTAKQYKESKDAKEKASLEPIKEQENALVKEVKQAEKLKSEVKEYTLMYPDNEAGNYYNGVVVIMDNNSPVKLNIEMGVVKVKKASQKNTLIRIGYMLLKETVVDSK